MHLSQPTPELPVPDVKKAQAYYRDHMGFDIAWYNEAGRIGAVSHGSCAIFFRETTGPIAPTVLWVFSETIDDTYDALKQQGAPITDPISDKAWGMRQFTLTDDAGHVIHVHHDL